MNVGSYVKNWGMTTVTEITNPNCGKKFWGCRNWRNRNDSGCNYFQFVVDDDDKCDDVDERDMKIARQKKKNVNLKHEVSFLKEELCNSRRCCKIAIMFGFVRNFQKVICFCKNAKKIMAAKYNQHLNGNKSHRLID
ncbi:hypothetical protein MTR_8g468130 [Medicago truncatula]|uniref:GRF zinc finger protein n=1 Tax=Medicago truncatula TaxID=3880 RepID=A0A072TQT6_MEDTR|nr:hypothetical protein MTR_8g468130 [Medicago truncatula]